MLLDGLCAALLGNLLTGNEVKATRWWRKQSESLAMQSNISGRQMIRPSVETIRADQKF